MLACVLRHQFRCRMPAFSFDKSRIRVLLLEGVHDSAQQHFRQAGYDNVTVLKEALSGDELAQALKGTHILGIRSRTQIDAAVLAAANRLVAIGCFCIGTNQVDLEAAKIRGIPVFNAPFSNTRSVAELVLAEAILLLRGVPRKNALAHQGIWDKSAKGAFEIRGKTLGIIGYGNIGSQLGVLAEALGMQVIYHDVISRLSMGNARPSDSLEALLRLSDVVSLHVPDTAATQNMIGAKQLALMKASAVLLNASRGTVIDLEALASALDNERLAGAAVDVFPQEPKGNTDPFVTPLANSGNQVRNVILTPHIGGSTEEAQENIGAEVAVKLTRYSDNGSTLSAVNFPEVTLPEHPSSHRLLHVHENVPGVLSKINGIFGELQVNVSAQYLQTRGNIGYVVIDLNAEHSDLALDQLRQIPGTIRTRVLF